MRKKTVIAAACALVIMLSISQVKASSSEDKFTVVMVPISATTVGAIKYNTETGESWKLRNGKWVKLEDKNNLPNGQYTVTMTGIYNDWIAVRLEVKTGKSWYVCDNKWKDIPHVTEVSDEEPSSPPANLPNQTSDGIRQPADGSSEPSM